MLSNIFIHVDTFDVREMLKKHLMQQNAEETPKQINLQ
jgi:hypothetical protein